MTDPAAPPQPVLRAAGDKPKTEPVFDHRGREIGRRLLEPLAALISGEGEAQPAPDARGMIAFLERLHVRTSWEDTALEIARAYLAKCAEVEGLTARVKAKDTALELALRREIDLVLRLEAAEARAEDCRANELAAIEQMQAAEARAAKLLEALEKYGRHKSICGSRDYAERLADKYCDCGLAAAKWETV